MVLDGSREKRDEMFGHLYPDFDSSRAHPLVQAAINRSKKVCADPIWCKLLVCLVHLSTSHEVALTSGIYNDFLFATIFSCCFYACHRSGELILKNSKDEFDWQKVIKCSSLTFDANCVSYCLPYHKSNCFYQGTDILFSSQQVANLVTLLRLYIQLCDCIHRACVTLFICEDGSLLNQNWFDSKFLIDLIIFTMVILCILVVLPSMLVLVFLKTWFRKIYTHDNPMICAKLQLACLHLGPWLMLFLFYVYFLFISLPYIFFPPPPPLNNIYLFFVPCLPGFIHIGLCPFWLFLHSTSGWQIHLEVPLNLCKQ